MVWYKPKDGGRPARRRQSYFRHDTFAEQFDPYSISDTSPKCTSPEWYGAIHEHAPFHLSTWALIDPKRESCNEAVNEVKIFYGILSMLQRRCSNSNGSQMTVHLKDDQYLALGEILTGLPEAVHEYELQFMFHGCKYTAQFPRTYTARKCYSTTTWTNEESLSYDCLLSISDRPSDCLESILKAAEALLRLLCETVINFKPLWLECLNAFGSLRPATVDLMLSYEQCSFSELITSQQCEPRSGSEPPLFRSQVAAFDHMRSWNKRKGYHLSTCLKGTKRLLRLHLVSSLLSENGTQPHIYRGGVSAIYQDRTNTVATRKELPMIIEGKEIKAQHDSGAERGNFMDYDLASELNLRLRNEKGNCKRFSMGNGITVKALGRVKAVCAFAKEAQTKMKCWFYVFDKLASPLIMGSQFLEKTKTLSDYVHRLQDCISNPGISPMVNLIGSTQHAKRRFTAYIDHRLTLINADTGSDLDLISSRYARAHGYRLDRRRRCRKRVRFADNTTAETIGQVQATLTLEDGSMYPKMFDVLPNLTSEVLLGQFTLEEISAFTFHRSSFVDVYAGERHLELSVLGYLGKVNEFLARKLQRVHRSKGQMQKQASLAKQQDDDLMEALQVQDVEAERLRLQNEESAASRVIQERADGNGSGSEPVQEDQTAPQRLSSTSYNTCA